VSDAWGSPAQGPRRQGPSPRRTLWIVAIVAVAAVLVRAHRITEVEILLFCALIPSVILHEVSHGAVALAFGDDTARRAGRLTLNPLRHIDPFGTLIMPALLVLSGVGAFGYAKPVPVNVSQLRHPRNESVVVSLVGPAVNIVLAVILGLAYRNLVPLADKSPILGSQPTWAIFLFVAGYVNVILAAFNLIPLPPLDGSAVVERLLPHRLLPGYYRIRPYTIFLPLLLIVADPSALSRLFTWALNQWANLVF
jgi:Zn-dependent protease